MISSLHVHEYRCLWPADTDLWLNVTETLNRKTAYTYDPKGNLTTITNALSKTTTLTVNAHGQPLTIKDPLNNTTFTYEAGNEALMDHED